MRVGAIGESEGAHNMRDLGGIPGAGSRLVRRHRLIRSGELSGLRPAGAAVLGAVGLGRIVDFRSAVERRNSPTVAHELSSVPRWQTSETESLGDPAPILRRCLVSVEQSREVMRKVYRNMPFSHGPAYRALIDAVLEARPVLFHCAAGKDRTGVAAALVLALLGVEREEIERDYSASEAVIEQTSTRFLAKPGNEIASDVPHEIWRPMLAADPAYLDAMFEEVKRRHGSVELYARDALGLPLDTAARLRDSLLE